MQRSEEELLVYIKLKHPHPSKNAEGFIDSLPDEYIKENFYKSQSYSVEVKRALAIAYIQNLKTEDTEYTDLMWNRLVRYYKENE